MNLIQESPILTGEASYGKKYWKMRLYEMPDGVCGWTTVTWRDRVNGDTTDPMESEFKPVRPTNVGKSNERGYRDQAVSHMHSSIKHMLDAGYVGPNGEKGDRASHDLLSAMLAHKYEKWHPGSEYEYTQPKLDGVRCLSDGLRFWSRGGKFLPEEALAHITIAVGGLPDGITLDGELMMPLGEYTFQQSVSRAKKYYPDGKQKLLRYHIYDCHIQGQSQLNFRSRRNILKRLFDEEVFETGCSMVKSMVAENHEEVLAQHAEYIRLGYEGTMIRNPYGVYEPGCRSANLLKFKDFIDEEFVILDVLEGAGQEAGLAIFLCATKDFKEFRTRPRGTFEQRAEWFRLGKSLSGQKLTVRYQNMTDDGVPRFPIGLGIRDYE